MTFARIRTDAEWANGTDLLPAELKALDDGQVLTVDGDAGGTYGFANGALSWGGAGAVAKAVWRFGVNTASATTCTVDTTSGDITHGDNDYFVFDAFHNAITPAILDRPTSWAAEALDTSYSTAKVVTYVGDMSAQAWGGTVPTFREGTRMLVPLSVVDGGTLDAASVEFVVGNSHANVPDVLPRFRLIRVNDSGTVEPLYTGTSEGWISFPTPASGAAWYNGGASQTISVLADGDAKCIVDISSYTYWLELEDESGANTEAENRYLSVSCGYLAVADLRPQ